MVFHLLNFTVQNRKNFFVAAKEMVVDENNKAKKAAAAKMTEGPSLKRQTSFHEKSQEQMQVINEPLQGQRGKEYEVMLKRLLNFYKSFFNYFRYGHSRLLKQMSTEYANIEANKKSLEAKEAEEQTKNALKSEIAHLHEKVEKLVAKSLVYWRILKTQKEDTTMSFQDPGRDKGRNAVKIPTILPMDLAESSLPASPDYPQQKDIRR